MLKSRYLLAIEFAIAGLLLALCYEHAVGNKIYLLGFFVSSTAFAVLNINFNRLYFLKYSALILYLGFWVKFALHTYYGAPYLEPVGRFDFTPQKFDELYKTLTLVFTCLTVVSLPFLWQNIRFRTMKIKYDTALLVLVLAVTLVLSVLNYIYGFQQAGLLPRTILPKGMAAMIFYFLSFSSGMILCWPLESYFGRKKNFLYLNTMPVYSIAAFSLLSRAHIVSMMCPVYFRYLFGELRRRSIPKLIFVSALVVSVILFMIDFSVVTVEREVEYNQALHNDSYGYNYNAHSLRHKTYPSFTRILIDRWIGIEGLMVSVGHPGKGPELFRNVISEVHVVGQNLKYESITGSKNNEVNSGKFNAMTILGPVATFYLSGSVGVLLVLSVGVFLGFALLELLISWSLRNETLSSVCGFYLALNFSQISWAPINLIKSLIAFSMTLLLMKAAEVVLTKYSLMERPALAQPE